MSCLLERIRGGDAATPPRRILLVPDLVVRASTGPAPGRAESEPALASNAG